MRIITGANSIALLVLFLITVLINETASASSLEDKEKALKIIGDFAERLCKDIPLEGQGKNIELTGSAKAELNGIIKTLANLGIEGAAKYQDTGYKGVLQKDLAIALKNSADCRLQIWNDLKDKFIPSTPPPKKTSPTLDPTTARFGITLGWQLARYEFVYDSPLPEAQAVSPSIKKDIEQLLKQDAFPHPVEKLNSQQLIDTVLLYYGTSNLKKHASVLLGIAAMRGSLVGASKNQQTNDEMKQLAYSAIKDIDESVLRQKEEFFNKMMENRPNNVEEVMGLLSKMKLI